MKKGRRKFILAQKNLTSWLPVLINKSGGLRKVATLKKGRLIFGSYYQRRPGGSWYTSIYRNGKRFQKVIKWATTEEEAEFVLRQRIIELFDEEYGVKTRRQESGFRTYAPIFREDYMKTVRRNFQSDIYRLNILCDYFKNTDLRSITPQKIREFIKSRLKAGNTRSTVNRYLALMKRIFNVAIEEGYAEENPVQKIKLFSEKDTLKERILTDAEDERLYEASIDYLKPIIATARNTGMRKGEILNLKKSQVDFKNRTIRVEKTKSGKVRYIPMNDILFNELRKLMMLDGQSPYVFFNPETGKPWHDLKRQFRNACRRAEIEGLRFHDLRHTFATRLAEMGVPVVTIGEILGHSSITTTQRYMHARDEKKREAVRLLERQRKNGVKMVSQEIQSTLIN